MPRLSHQLTALIYPSRQVSGQWVAHCLELDLVTQGNSEKHALEMMAEAVELVAEENVRNGLPPLVFRSAPVADWNLLRSAEPMNITRILSLRWEPSDEVTINPLVASAG